MDAYERAVVAAGAWGKFQRQYNILYNAVLCLCFTMVYMNIVLVLAVPAHWCKLPNQDANSSLLQWKQAHIPLERDAKGKEVFSSCKIYVNGTNESTECAAYDYDGTWYGSTAATAHDWVCGRELLVANVFAYSRLGEVAGGVALGWLGDTYGRKAAQITALVLMISGRIMTVLSFKSFTVFLLGCVITALPSGIASQSTMVTLMESTTAENRARVVMVQNLAWATGMTLLPLFYWWLRDWLTFVLVTTGTVLPFLVMSRQRQNMESPRWLWSTGRSKACLKQLRYIAWVNDQQLSPTIEKELLEEQPANVTSLGPLAVFSSCTLATNTVLVLTLWFCGISCYAVVMMSGGAGDEEGNPFLLLVWQGLVEIPGYVAGPWLADRIGRRLTSCSALGATAALNLLIALTATGWAHSWILNTSLLLVSKMCLTANYYVLTLIATEIYPTCLRQTGLSFGTVFSAASFGLAPYIIYLGRRVDARLPGLIVAGLSVTGLLAASFLPETLHAALPGTLQDAQEFGRNRRRDYFKFPQKVKVMEINEDQDETMALEKPSHEI